MQTDRKKWNEVKKDANQFTIEAKLLKVMQTSQKQGERT